jgi:transposase
MLIYSLMKANTFSLGGISLIDKVEKDFGLVSGVFEGVTKKAKDFQGRVKLLLYNRLTHGVSIHQILETYPRESFELLGLKDEPSERSLYRTVEQVGKCYPILLERYQDVMVRQGLVDRDQLLDFSSTYFEGEKAALGAYGYSRDHRPDRKQVNFGISTGINDVPSALTIQRGNVQDREHVGMLLNVAERVLEEGSLLIFDAGANSKGNKKRIREMKHHYLTLKPKKVKTYKKYIQSFWREEGLQRFKLKKQKYVCVKKQEGEEFLYIFFSPRLFKDQVRKKWKKFEKQKEKGDRLVKKARRHKPVERYPSEKGWVELYPRLQAALKELDNPYITGIEGFFILESSVDAEPEKILRLYRDRDKAEKFVRGLKEGVELRPIRHWSKWAIIGAVFIGFLTAAITNLTVNLRKNSPVKNVKLLKKHLQNLTVTVIYPENAFRLAVVSNISPPIKALFGDFVHRYGDKHLHLRW